MKPEFSACIVAALFLLVPVGARSAGSIDSLEMTIQRENATLRSCEPEQCPVFYVSVLGRAFPIPSRYMLLPGIRTPSRFRNFVSPVSAFASRENLVGGKVITGIITIGPLDELKKSEAEGAVELRLLRSSEGIEIFLLTLREAQRPPLSYVLVSGNEYVQIGDQNEQLAELLVGISARTNLSKTSTRQ